MIEKEDAIVIFENASIFQENHLVLSDINFSIRKGEFCFLVGRTGSGKSSLLKTIYSDLELRQGKAQVCGFDLNGIQRAQVPFLRRKLGIIFQDFQLFPDRTVNENLVFVMEATGWKEASKMKKRIAEVLMRVGLGTSGSKMPHQLSGGEQQRIVIARSLLNEPSLIIADEPTGNLDPNVSEGIFELFEEINNSGTAILMATHNHNLIANHPARVLKCIDGKLLDSEEDTFELQDRY
ncbi:MAG: ATP-binding cassette domain-containing protein [Cyclobacteriaceae bacterium]|nr:ATP-binding cassette domain-containing protein [Cyclobacteriaceae bacterium]MCH8516086.1 ATP-binding cassette domain-containing protein [Cyclobacteriaceae bacterium]